jgi:hypothetical protein
MLPQIPGLLLLAWVTENCTENYGESTFPDSASDGQLNISNFDIYRSLRLNRSLLSHEQLDLSVASDLGSWYSNKDQYSPNSASCEIFIRSFTAIDDLTACIPVPEFTCHRIWTNFGV